MFNDVNKILVIGAHADDMEIGCGGTVHKLIQQGKEVYLLTLSFNLKGMSSSFSEGQIKEEVY